LKPQDFVTPMYNTPAPPPEERSASASTSTLPPLETEFLDIDFGMQNSMGDGIDWEALMNDGELWNNFGGPWNAEGIQGQDDSQDFGRGV
jgi:hypothetical protein